MSATPYKSPSSLLAELGIKEPQDIRLEAIAQYCGATILYEPLEGSEARIIGYGNRAIITVNSLSPSGRRRFSAGHELGHWMRDRGSVAFACDTPVLISEWGDENAEVRANRYAADLLLPRSMVRPRVRGQPITLDTARTLATEFAVSRTAAAIRLVELGSFPAMAICTEAGHRRWFVRGPDVPERLWPHQQIGKNTVAWDIVSGNATTERRVDVYASEWIDHSDAGRYTVREDSARIVGDSVLTLLWWKDERQILDLDPE